MQPLLAQQPSIGILITQSVAAVDSAGQVIERRSDDAIHALRIGCDLSRISVVLQRLLQIVSVGADAEATDNAKLCTDILCYGIYKMDCF